MIQELKIIIQFNPWTDTASIIVNLENIEEVSWKTTLSNLLAKKTMT